ncbi:hypothetical protein KDD30_12515 [Photobacterium sp. GJ3]|uniref:hypothetical protein n=1 Tax=Photobacterium sp. GJ3 TaxID=2829502 RepID=UPI001B8C47AF|nr:hypothetical protein [Photobacterium sp. GJ3]QUJ66928.1 hypothetical protein KDD30_12515 [Photobacterium sp. GJ3]
MRYAPLRGGLLLFLSGAGVGLFLGDWLNPLGLAGEPSAQADRPITTTEMAARNGSASQSTQNKGGPETTLSASAPPMSQSSPVFREPVQADSAAVSHTGTGSAETLGTDEANAAETPYARLIREEIQKHQTRRKSFTDAYQTFELEDDGGAEAIVKSQQVLDFLLLHAPSGVLVPEQVRCKAHSCELQLKSLQADYDVTTVLMGMHDASWFNFQQLFAVNSRDLSDPHSQYHVILLQ